jgi:hypothetical protein
MTKRGGDFGGGPLPRRLTLTEKAARFVRQRATITGTRATTEAMQATASQVLEAMADGALVWILNTEDVQASVVWLQEARAMCASEAGQRGLDQIQAAILTAQAKR